MRKTSLCLNFLTHVRLRWLDTLRFITHWRALTHDWVVLRHSGCSGDQWAPTLVNLYIWGYFWSPPTLPLCFLFDWKAVDTSRCTPRATFASSCMTEIGKRAFGYSAWNLLQKDLKVSGLLLLRVKWKKPIQFYRMSMFLVCVVVNVTLRNLSCRLIPSSSLDVNFCACELYFVSLCVCQRAA